MQHEEHPEVTPEELWKGIRKTLLIGALMIAFIAILKFY